MYIYTSRPAELMGRGRGSKRKLCTCTEERRPTRIYRINKRGVHVSFWWESHQIFFCFIIFFCDWSSKEKA